VNVEQHEPWIEPMTTYYFNVKGPHGRNLDPCGTDLPDHAHAIEHARQVALELMRCRETKTRSWRFEVSDASRVVIFELLFASVDPLVAELRPELRKTVIEASARQANLVDAIIGVQNSLHQVMGTLAKVNGEPYLATLDGTTL